MMPEKADYDYDYDHEHEHEHEKGIPSQSSVKQ